MSESVEAVNTNPPSGSGIGAAAARFLHFLLRLFAAALE